MGFIWKARSWPKNIRGHAGTSAVKAGFGAACRFTRKLQTEIFRYITVSPGVLRGLHRPYPEIRQMGIAASHRPIRRGL